MNDIQVFSNNEFGSVRTVVINGEPWLVAKDVASALGYARPENVINERIEKEDKLYIDSKSHPEIGGEIDYKELGQRGGWLINESGMYSLIFGSQLESAKRFKHWVTSEVLPSIRKNDGYIKDQENMTPEQVVANALIVAQKIIADKDKQIEEMQPKSDYFDSLVDSKLYTTFRDAAKEFHIPPQEFTQWLVDNGYLYRDKHKMLKPYEPYIKNGLFVMKDFKTPAGFSNVQTFVTVKGKETFRLLLSIRNK